MKKILHKLLKYLLEVIYPNTCPVCGDTLDPDSDLYVCEECDRKLKRVASAKFAHVIIENRFADLFEFDAAVNLFFYAKGTAVQTLVHQVKYHGRQDTGRQIGKELGQLIIDNGRIRDIDMIIPVPLHPKRMRKRGFNQSETVADGIADVTGWKVETDAVARTVHNESQTKMNGETRWDNVHGIFKVTKPENIIGKRILVIDDIVTTGATLTSLCKELLEYKSVTICIAAVACTLPD